MYSVQHAVCAQGYSFEYHIYENPPLRDGAGGKQTVNMKKLTNALVFFVFPFVVVLILIGPLLIG